MIVMCGLELFGLHVVNHITCVAGPITLYKNSLDQA